MKMSGPEVFVRVVQLKGLSADALRNFPKGRVTVSSELSNVKASTLPAQIGASKAVNEVTWGTNEGMIKWSMSTEEMTHLKAVQPKLKLNIMLQSEGGSGELHNYGYVLLDMRDLVRVITSQSFKVHGMNGAELVISAKLNTVLHAKLFPTAASSSSSADQPKIITSSSSFSSSSSSALKADSGAISVAASTDSVRSVLRLALSEGRGESGTKVRFSLAISLEDYHDLGALCKRIVDDDKVAASKQSYPLPTRTFWLCWTVFDKLFQSEEFSHGDDGPQRVRDTIRVECPLSTLPENLTSANPLRIYLCSQDHILASTEVPLPVLTPEVADRDDVSLTQLGWGYFVTPVGSASPYSETRPAVPSVKVGVQFTIESIIPSAASASAAAEALSKAETGAEEEEEEADDNYEEDQFEEEAAAGGGGGDKSRSVKFKLDESGSSPPSSRQASAPQPPPPPPLGLFEEGEEPYDEAEEELLRHFRISVEVRSLGGFKRPAHIGLSFAYPYLGSSAPTRTHPVWVLANSETRIDGAAASYECVLSRSSLRETLRMHPLRIQAHSRSLMGSTAAGEVCVDLASAHAAAPHSFRCPLTQRTFKSRSEYSKHRQTMLALRSAGRVPSAPPAEPVVIRATDAFLVFASTSGSSAAEGGKARVVVIVEDIGKVGPENNVGVQLGYRSHGAGVYVNDGRDTALLGQEALEDAAVARDPLSREDLTPEERARLEVLKLEWESWRRGAETAWREALREKEAQLKKRLEGEAAAALAGRADDLRRAHEEAGRLEVRLRSAIDAAERQRQQLSIKEEQMHMKLAQKTGELQLLQKRVRDEAKIRVETETRRADSLQHQLDSLNELQARTDKRARETEKEFEVCLSFRPSPLR